jgi:SAM-dependent methyltransferase
MEYKQAFLKRGSRYDYAVNKYGNVLKEEFTTAVRVLDLKPFESVVVIPAGGMPLHKYIDDKLNIAYHAFEPLKNEHNDFSMKYCELTQIPLGDCSIDKMITLATFHHVHEKREETLTEFRRVLKNEGILVIGDVIEGSPQATWLNEFVNKWNSNGHNGYFLQTAHASDIEKLGFQVEVSTESYNWSFDNDDEALDFVLNLFGLDLIEDTNTLLDAMKDILGYHNLKFRWELMYFKCKKVT